MRYLVSIGLAIGCISFAAHPGRADARKPTIVTVTNSLGMRLVKIPAGEFVMGSSETGEQLQAALNLKNVPIVADEQPAHPVRITKPFLMGACEVTVGEFKKFVDATGYKTDAERPEKNAKGVVVWTGTIFGRSSEHNWRTWWKEQADEHPVVNVSWNDAVAFCEWLSKQEEKKYRLPTEAEWEYGCRGGTTTRFWSGDDAEGIQKVANFADARKHPPGTILTLKVGTMPANAFGLHDMAGNVWEWVADSYAADYYQKSPTDDPRGPETGSIVLRGGCWAFPIDSGRSARRGRAQRTTCGYRDGFRVVCEIAE